MISILGTLNTAAELNARPDIEHPDAYAHGLLIRVLDSAARSLAGLVSR